MKKHFQSISLLCLIFFLLSAGLYQPRVVTGPKIYPVRNEITMLNPLLYLPDICSPGGMGIDQSGRHNDMQASQTTIVAGTHGPVQAFDGTDDYVYQLPLASGSDALDISTTNGVAFADGFTGVDLSDYIGCMLVVTDGSGNRAFAYIKSVGTGLTEDDNLIVNPTFDVDTTGWSAVDATLASIAGGQSNNCLQMTRTGGVGQSASQALAGWTAGNLYHVGAYARSGTSGNGAARLAVSGVAAEGYIIDFTSSGAWVLQSGYRTAQTTGNRMYLIKNNDTAGTMLFDESFIYQVLTPSSSGCVLKSTHTGSTENWTYIQAGFNGNTIASWEIRRADLQLYGSQAFSIGCWFCPAGVGTASELPIICKRAAGGAVDGFGLYQYEDDIRFKIDDADYAEASAVLTANEWVWIVGTFDGTTARVYVNGILGATTDTGTVTDTVNQLRIGYDGTAYGAGKGIGWCVFGKALHQAEVQNIYNSAECQP